MLLAGYDNPLASITATAVATATGYGPERLKNRQLWVRTRTPTGTFTLDLTWDAGASRDWPFVALLGQNLLDDATVRWRVGNDPTWAVTLHDVSEDAFDLSRPRPVSVRKPWGIPIIHVPATPWTGRYLRVTLTDVSRVSGHVELAHALSGTALTLHPRRAMSFASDVEVGATGLRRWVLPVVVERADLDVLASIHEWSASTESRLLLIPHPEETDTYQYEVVWGVAMDDVFDGAYRADSLRYIESRIGIEEVAI
jgi:hypothetical protein